MSLATYESLMVDYVRVMKSLVRANAKRECHEELRVIATKQASLYACVAARLADELMRIQKAEQEKGGAE